MLNPEMCHQFHTFSWVLCISSLKFLEKSRVSAIDSGVFFRKSTLQQATELGLVGWVMNTTNKTVVGEAQGAKEQIEKLEIWLRTTGSPKSTITELKSKKRGIDELTFDTFTIRK
jgi:acylphosphatase